MNDKTWNGNIINDGETVWLVKVSFIHQLMHQWFILKNGTKIYIKIYIKTAQTCFGVRVKPSSGSALIRAY